MDFSFKLNGITQFFLEAKRLSEDLNNPELIGQAINYAWLKGCSWAVLSNFESIRIFNAEWKVASPFQSHLKTIHYHEFLSRFEELWLLSKESFQNKLLDREAEKWGKKATKISVDKQLFFDFTQFRDILSKTIHKLNTEKQLTEIELDESVQRILDRLIFIRNCEDRELEDKVLIYTLRKWESSLNQDLFFMLHDVFEYFNENYNSEIFKPHLCDKLKIDDLVLKEIIERLYFAKDNIAFYDFSIIEADVLGNIYEQYLSHILNKNTKKPSLNQSYAHRKEQGIYYTPTYIVDFIVKNTLGEILKTKKKGIEKLRVLDPACGSGSFLIKAFDILNEHYQKYDKDYKQAEFDFQTGLAYT
ncbi:MAG: SAM-dependent methyltransferase, partial [Leptospiraceae bacterium]|nr:SAM-dependent methyltransferase [Leptospiraceae bacterium]